MMSIKLQTTDKDAPKIMRARLKKTKSANDLRDLHLFYAGKSYKLNLGRGRFLSLWRENSIDCIGLVNEKLYYQR